VLEEVLLEAEVLLEVLQDYFPVVMVVETKLRS
jgi:hypothetical protein